MSNLDVQELVRNNQPIYVKNCTGRYLESQGPYVLEIRDGNKRVAQIIIPATKYPFLVSGHVPAKLLAESTEFYAALSKGILELVDPDEARSIMSSTVAQQVQEQALRKFQPVRREARAPMELTPTAPVDHSNRRPPGADMGISTVPDSQVPLVVAGTAEGDKATERINPSVIQIVMDLQSDSSLYEEKFLDLAGMEGLTDLDLGYLLSNCKNYPKILQFAKSELASKVGNADEDDSEEEETTEAPASPRKRRRGRR